MGSLQVILADLVAEGGPNRTGVIDFPSPIRETLNEMFQRVVDPNGAITAVSVTWWSLSCRGGSRVNPGPRGMAPPLGPQDLIVYFVREPSDSVVVHMPGVTTGPKAGSTGYTVFPSSLTASEIYTHGIQYDPVGMANLAFHELMHFASHLDDPALHGTTTFQGLSTSLALMPQSGITSATAISDGDVAFMAHYLPMANRQPWTGGYAAYIDPANGHI